MKKKNKVNRKPLISLLYSFDIAKGLSDRHRSKILDILYHRELSVKELIVYLKRSKFDIAVTTLRHHVNILKKSGLIKISKTKEVKGTVVKYYKANFKLLFIENSLLKSGISKYKQVIISAYSKIYNIIKKMIFTEKAFNNLLSDLKIKSKTCKACKINHSIESMIFLVLNIAITKSIRRALRSANF